MTHTPGPITLNRDQLAALLAHHADVLATQLRTDTARNNWIAAEQLDAHAVALTADEEAPAVAELLDLMLTFPVEQVADEPAPLTAMHAATPALLAEIRWLRAAMEEIQHLHKDSPMGPCPVCIDADAVAAGGDGLMPYPCPTGRLAGAQDCDPPHVRAAWYTAAGDEMAASLVRDGFGDDEIADMARRAAATAEGE